MRKNKIQVFYRPEQVLREDNNYNFSKSPLKPKLLIEFLQKHGLWNYFDLHSDWQPFQKKDFLLAHTEEYVHGFFSGIRGICESNGLKWSVQFADSVRYTNASLYEAIRFAVLNPSHITFSPTSGFHHAHPHSGSGFCTFSGQVIASVKMYREYGISGAYIDLDGHFGNSIEDARSFVKDLNQAVPMGCNINPDGEGKLYLKDLQKRLSVLYEKLITQQIHYVVFPHGADSHEWDDMDGQCTTEEWLQSSNMVYTMILNASKKLGKPVPLTLTLFGGYRSDDYDSVLSLHTDDITICLNILCGSAIDYSAQVKPRRA